MIASRKKTQEILDRNNLRAKKSFGQNFLIDENVVRKIVEKAGVDKETGVIEIGPGIGSLTEELLTRANKVLAYEIDEKLIGVLTEELNRFDNLKILNVDFLKSNLDSDLEYFNDCNKVIVVSNLPYYITTAIIFKLLEKDNRIEEFYFMVQKEVGLRLTSKPNTKDYNSLSVLMSYKTVGKVLFDVSRNSFLPSPNVDSSIIMLKKRKVELGLKNEAKFLTFVRVIFNQRRKTLVNNVLNGYSLDKTKLQEIFDKLNINISVRAEVLGLEEIANLYIEIFEAPSN